MSLPRYFAVPAAAVVFLTMSSTASAAAFSFTGTFNQDDDVRVFNFDVSSMSVVTLRTQSYAGGTNANGAVIPAGGFHPVLSLFSSTGMLLDSVSSGVCGPQNLDAVTGLCGDAFLEQSLSAGSYTVALTQFFNVPVGPNLSDGFLQAGTGNFTGSTCSVPGGAFLDTADVDCAQRTNFYAVDILGADVAGGDESAVPEPATFLLFLPAFIVMAVVARQKQAASSRV